MSLEIQLSSKEEMFNFNIYTWAPFLLNPKKHCRLFLHFFSKSFSVWDRVKWLNSLKQYFITFYLVRVSRASWLGASSGSRLPCRGHCRGHTGLLHPLQPQMGSDHGILSRGIQFTHLLIHLVVTAHQGCITTFVGCRYFVFVGSFLYKSTLKIILNDCVSMIMPTIQAGFIIIYKLSLHFPSHLKQVQTKLIYLETKKINLWLPKRKR